MEVKKSTGSELIFEMEEPGDFVLYSKSGSINSDHFEFRGISNGFYEGRFLGSEGVDQFKIHR